MEKILLTKNCFPLIISGATGATGPSFSGDIVSYLYGNDSSYNLNTLTVYAFSQPLILPSKGTFNSGVFTAGVTGTYRYSYQINSYNISNSNVYKIDNYVTVNQATTLNPSSSFILLSTTSTGGGNYYLTTTLTGIINLNAGDTLSLQYFVPAISGLFPGDIFIQGQSLVSIEQLS